MEPEGLHFILERLGWLVLVLHHNDLFILLILLIVLHKLIRLGPKAQSWKNKGYTILFNLGKMADL